MRENVKKLQKNEEKLRKMQENCTFLRFFKVFRAISNRFLKETIGHTGTIGSLTRTIGAATGTIGNSF